MANIIPIVNNVDNAGYDVKSQLNRAGQAAPNKQRATLDQLFGGWLKRMRLAAILTPLPR